MQDSLLLRTTVPHPVYAGRSDGPLTVLAVNVPLVQQQLLLQLDRAGDIEILDVLDRFDDGFETTYATRPKVVVLGIGPPAEKEIHRVRLLRLVLPEVKVLAVAQSPGEALALKALDCGCSGFLGHVPSPRSLELAVRSAAGGHLSFPSEVVGCFLDQLERRRQGVHLTVREREILILLGEGESTGAISEILSISPHTVRNHVGSILGKLNVRSRIEAVLIADSLDLIDLGGAAGSGRRSRRAS